MGLASCLIATKLLLAAWVVLSSAEWLHNLPLLREDGLLSFQVLRLRPSLLRSPALQGQLYSVRTVQAVLCARIAAAVALLLPRASAADLPASLLILLSCGYLARRTRFGGDGSDQMGMVLALGVTLMSAGRAAGDPPLAWCGVLAICGQALLAYPAAGIAKWVSPVWRSGVAVPRVMDTQSYGHAAAARLAAGSPLLSRALCWLIILSESLFPVVLLLPPRALLASLVCFAIFHLCNAYFMGLNAFVWSFLGTYPSVMLANAQIRHSLGWAAP
jgi:hypothetical protein